MPGEDPPVEQVLLDDAAGVVAECADVDEAEDWASSAQILFRPVGPGGSRVMDASKPDEAESVASAVCRFAYAWSDGDPLCWSPRRVEHFLCVWIPAKSVCDDEWHDIVEWVFPMWLRFAAPRRGLAAELLDLNLETARESFVDMRRNAADPANRSPTTNLVTEMLDDGIDLSDEAMVQEWIDRYNARPRRERW